MSVEKFYHKKAAMFGLDARITIFVMGVIAAITFYLGKNIIQEYQNKNIIEQVEVLRNMALQHIIDNGISVSVDSNNLFGVSDIDNAIIPISRNKNSYITEPDFAASANNGVISTPLGNININLKNLVSSVAFSGESYSSSDCPNTSKTCYYWLELKNVPKKYYLLLNKYYDQEDSSAYRNSEIVAIPGQDLNTYTGNVLINVGER